MLFETLIGCCRLAAVQQSSPGLNSSELSLDSAGSGGTDELLMANATRLLRIVTAHLTEAVGEQRNIVWLRLPSTDGAVLCCLCVAVLDMPFVRSYFALIIAIV